MWPARRPERPGVDPPFVARVSRDRPARAGGDASDAGRRRPDGALSLLRRGRPDGRGRLSALQEQPESQDGRTVGPTETVTPTLAARGLSACGRADGS